MSRNSKVLLGVVGRALLVFVVLPVFAGSGLFGSGPMMGRGGMMGPGGMMGQGGMMGGGWGIFGIRGILVPLLLGGLVAAIVWAVTQLGSGRHAAGSARVHDQSAEEILQQRIARGEIDAEEYKRSLEVLRSGRVSENGRMSEKSGAKEA